MARLEGWQKVSSHTRPQYKIKYARVMPSGQVRFRKRFKSLMTDAATRISAVILREAVEDSVPVTSIDRIQRQANSILTGVFGGRQAVGADGGPQSPYARALLEEAGRVTYEIVRAHQAYIADVSSPEVVAWLRSGIVPPMQEMTRLSELTEDEVRRRFPSLDEDDVRQVANNRLFEPNALAEYEPAHTWVDPNGYRLSERIWQTDQRTRAKLDGLLTDLIASGTSAREIAQLSERFLIPGREKIRTNKPYGSDASYDGMRLGRTEIAHAANQAAYISAQQNPYVDRMEVVRSANGDPTCPICPQHATIGITGARLRPAYRLSQARLSPFHPHCMCRGQSVAADDVQAVEDELRGFVQRSRETNLRPYVNPADADAFTQRLLGDALWAVLRQVLPQQPALL